MSKNIVSKMMSDRGFTETKNNIYKKDNETTIVLWYDRDISIEYVSNLKKQIDSAQHSNAQHSHEQYTGVILIKSGKITPVANTALTQMGVVYKIEIFDYNELMYNPTEHEDVPRYEFVPPSDVKKLLAEYSSKKSQLPRMHYTDPIRRYYGWNKGDVVRETADDEIYYRIIV